MRFKASSLIIGISYTIFASLVTVYLTFPDCFYPDKILNYKDGLSMGLVIAMIWIMFLVIWDSLREKEQE